MSIAAIISGVMGDLQSNELIVWHIVIKNYYFVSLTLYIKRLLCKDGTIIN